MHETLLRANRLSFLLTPLMLATVAAYAMWASLRSGSEFAPPAGGQPPAFKERFSLQARQKISPVLLALPETTLRVTLPDLKQELSLVGRNDRPDAGSAKATLYLGLRGLPEPVPITPGEKLYLVRSTGRAAYQPSPANHPTSLWLEAETAGPSVLVRVRIETPEGVTLLETADGAAFTLVEQPSQNANSGIEIGKYRMDSSLFARQRARWIGPDLFLQLHGGREYEMAVGKQRIEFGEGEEAFACYIGEGDCLVWIDNCWKEASAGTATEGLFLLQARKVEDRLMHFQLWDPTGRAKVALTLVRPSEPPLMTRVVEEFKYVGARSLRQWIFDIQGVRSLVKAGDWWLQTDKGWVKLKTPGQIDDYVSRCSNGYLFVIEGVVRKKGLKMLAGRLFNPTRTQAEKILLPLSGGAAAASPAEGEAAAAPPPVEPAAGRRQEEDFYHKEMEESQQLLKKPAHSRGTL